MRMRWVAGLLKLFIRNPKIRGMDKVSPEEGAVYCANHQAWYGPVVLMLYGGVSWRPWVNAEIMEKERCAPYLLKDFIGPVLHFRGGGGVLLSRILAPLCIRLMGLVGAIPVHHGSRRILETFRESAEALVGGKSLLIFPERPSLKEKERVQPFQGGFLGIAREHWKRTGKALSFYPVYVDKRRRAITFGDKISYRPESPYPLEKERILRELEEGVRSMEGRAYDDL